MAVVSCAAVLICFGEQPFPITNSFDKRIEKVQGFFAMASLALCADMSVGIRISEVSWKLRQYVKTWIVHTEAA